MYNVHQRAQIISFFLQKNMKTNLPFTYFIITLTFAFFTEIKQYYVMNVGTFRAVKGKHTQLVFKT